MRQIYKTLKNIGDILVINNKIVKILVPQSILIIFSEDKKREVDVTSFKRGQNESRN